jgi:hypothetical protein
MHGTAYLHHTPLTVTDEQLQPLNLTNNTSTELHLAHRASMQHLYITIADAEHHTLQLLHAFTV